MPMIFLFLALFTVVMAIGTVTARNLFHAALFLVGAFFGVATIYVLLEAEFLAVSQIIIYIGAIATLIVFAIMLSRSMLGREAGGYNRFWVAAAVGAAALLALLAWVLTTVPFPVVDQPVPADAITQIGTGLVGPYVIPFEVASVLLVVALIGAVMIARERHRQR